jgi:Protein kinase domain
MGDVPTKPGHGPPKVRNALDDTVRAESSLVPTAVADATTPLPGPERYRLGAELGRGGMGRVVEAFDLQLGRTVAFKEVLATAGASLARRFVREVQLTARLEHPSIVPLYDAGTTTDGRPFYVMRRVSGQPLAQLMAQAADLRARLVLLPAVLAAIDAVAHAHRRGVIHRDLKPANILVGELGETTVIDWGLAKAIGEQDDPLDGEPVATSDGLRTQLGAVFGTPGFMAPEQARGEQLDPRGDVYALGATLYQLLAGAPPHAGTSATEMIANTGTREVTPVDVVAPGAPPELVAIVGKALAFDQARRYPDAGALGEDVRRFLAGQLVAAHRYTRRERIARIARRHRAALSVAALAMVSVAALAWVGVQRIVEERDAATTARAVANVERAAAERARDLLQQRADQLVVAQARGVVERNPTHAAALLKQLPEGSHRLGDARALAQAAIVRGTAWAMQVSDQVPAYAELSDDGRFLVQALRDGIIRVIDLDHRRLVIARQYGTDARAVWVGKAVLVTRERGAPELLDPFVGQIRVLPVSSMIWAVATAAGDRVGFLDAARAAHLLDVAAGTALPLWPGHRVDQIAIASDGSWIALADRAGVAVLDATGRELTSRPGAATRLFGSRFGDVGFLAADKVLVCKLTPRPVWTELDLKPWQPGRAVDVLYRGHELDIYVAPAKILAWNGSRLWERMRIDGLSFGLVEADRELLIAPGNDGQLHFENDLVTGALHLPIALTNLRVLARPGVPRVIALGRGMIVGFELADSLPERLPRARGGGDVQFVGDDALLLAGRFGGDWRWYDVVTRRSTPVAFEPAGLTSIVDVDHQDGRVLVRDTTTSSALVVLRKGAAAPRELARGAAVWGRLLPRGSVVFGVGDGRLLAVQEGGPAREVAKLDGIVELAVGLGANRFAAVSSSGELVRGSLATSDLERTRIAPGTTSVLAADRAGRVVIGQDGRLLVWDRDVTEVARFDQRIHAIFPLDDGALLELSDHSMIRIALVAGAASRHVLAASGSSPLVSADRRLIVAPSVNGQVVVVETATLATWELPAYRATHALVTIAPTARRFVDAGFGQAALWTLPAARLELRAWLDERTNALTDPDHALIWPWQAAARP